MIAAHHGTTGHSAGKAPGRHPCTGCWQVLEAPSSRVLNNAPQEELHIGTNIIPRLHKAPGRFAVSLTCIFPWAFWSPLYRTSIPNPKIQNLKCSEIKVANFRVFKISDYSRFQIFWIMETQLVQSITNIIKPERFRIWNTSGLMYFGQGILILCLDTLE